MLNGAQVQECRPRCDHDGEDPQFLKIARKDTKVHTIAKNCFFSSKILHVACLSTIKPRPCTRVLISILLINNY